MSLGVDIYANMYILRDMSNTANTNTAEALTNMINDMINDRKAYATANGFTASDDEIADHIKASLIRMMSEDR